MSANKCLIFSFKKSPLFSNIYFSDASSCPYLATKITPAIPIVGAVLYIFTMSSLLRTTFTDPGVIPRASHDEAAYIEKQIGKIFCCLLFKYFPE